MSKGEKFLSYGDRWEFCWFWESRDAVDGVKGAPVLRAEERSEPAVGSDHDGRMIDRAELVGLSRKVEAIIRRVVADNPEPAVDPHELRVTDERLARAGAAPNVSPFIQSATQALRDDLREYPPPYTRGEDFVLELYSAYVRPDMIRGYTEESQEGERRVVRLVSGAIIQAHDARPVNQGRDAIPGLVCAEGDGSRDSVTRARLVAACRAYRAAREACGFEERGHERLELLSAHAAELAGVDRSSMARAVGLPKGELRAKAGAKTYSTITVTSDDAVEAERNNDLRRFLLKLREMTKESEARISRFARAQPSK